MSKSRKSRVRREKAKHRTNMCKIRAADNSRWNRKSKNNSSQSIDDMIAALEMRLNFHRR